MTSICIEKPVFSIFTALQLKNTALLLNNLYSVSKFTALGTGFFPILLNHSPPAAPASDYLCRKICPIHPLTVQYSWFLLIVTAQLLKIQFTNRPRIQQFINIFRPCTQ